MKALLLARRNFKEILRDPLSFVFCLGFPAILLIAFRLINYHVGSSWMSMADLVPGVAVFSLSFIMLYMTLLVSKDRTTSFLSRLYNAPVRAIDFIIGYALPGMVLGVLQSIITYTAGLLVSLFPSGHITTAGIETISKGVDYTFSPPVTLETAQTLPYLGIFSATLTALPAILLFVAFGILLGTVLNDRAAPGVSSAIITASGLLGGAWMPLAAMGSFEDFCRVLPFYPATTVARNVFIGATLTAESFGLPFLTVTLWCLALFAAAILLFCRAMQSDRG